MSGSIGSLTAAAAALRALERGRVLLAVDFDGTIAPLVDHPDSAVPVPEAVEYLRQLAAVEHVEVAVVSGRSLADLRLRLGEVPGAILVGEHGNDIGEEVEVGDAIEEARRFVEAVRAGREIVVEHKPRSVTFHTRMLEPDAKQDAVSTLRTWAAEHPDVTILEGKEVVELSVADLTKGDAIVGLASEVDVVLYIGDDTTDEAVFAVLRADDVGVKVGPGPTAARYRVDDVNDVVEVLRVLALASS
jgi:trehalose-phosphatase